MGSLEGGVQTKRTPLLRSSSLSVKTSFLHRPRSRLARFLLFEKVDYFQWIFTVAAFLFVVVLFQAFLPASITEKDGDAVAVSRDLNFYPEIGGLDFGEGIQFHPFRFLEKFWKEDENNSSRALSRPRTRAAFRKPCIALVLPDLSKNAMQLRTISIAASLLAIGYEIQVYSAKEGPVHNTWRNIGLPVNILSLKNRSENSIDWLNYDGIIVNSLENKEVISCLLQEPFKSLPVAWIVDEKSLALRINQYNSSGQIELFNDWKQAFNRATVVIFPNYVLPMMYSAFDIGNYYVIPGSPVEACEAHNSDVDTNFSSLQTTMKYQPDDFIIAIVGSQFSYSGSLLEHALVLQALMPLLIHFPTFNSSNSHMKVLIIYGHLDSSPKLHLEEMAVKLGYPRSSVLQVNIDGDLNNFLGVADVVLYGSFLEEQTFPGILLEAMCLGKPVVVPNLDMMKRHIDDKMNGYIFPKENMSLLTHILLQIISDGKISASAHNVALSGKQHAKNLFVSEAIEGYVSLLEKIIKFPSEVLPPKAVSDVPSRLRDQWQWHLFEEITNVPYLRTTFGNYSIIEKVEEFWNHTHSAVSTGMLDEAFSMSNWEEEKFSEIANARKKREEDELKDRTDQPHGTWEEVYRNAKKADRSKSELHERDDKELERIGQPLCIYEPYLGQGAWPFLQKSSLYRGIGLSTKGRRPGADDIDASSRLPLLNNGYYRDVLGEFGAFFALANRIDRIHKNAWIGFQSWRAKGRKASLTKTAENVLLEAIQSRRHGDTLYFWVRMDRDPRNSTQQDFWSFCDSINAGNCRFAVSEALRRMYGMQTSWNSLPPMPNDGDTWSVMHSWALPTRSFLEFIMFSRMFVDALDMQIYDEHHQSGHCYLSLSKDRHCYSRLLELLINVWAYHSPRRMIYVNPETGTLQEQHKLKNRRGKMWIKWFSFATLKSMDEDLAEEADIDYPGRRWLWPSTGEVFWQGIYERERNMRRQQKAMKKKNNRDKIQRIKSRIHQKTIGKYVKPPPEDLNTTASL